MPQAPKVLAAAEMDEMTPDQRAAAFREHLVTDLDALPAEFRERVTATARGLADELESGRGS